jgi:hypothetical protein
MGHRYSQGRPFNMIARGKDQSSSNVEICLVPCRYHIDGSII